MNILVALQIVLLVAFSVWRLSLKSIDSIYEQLRREQYKMAGGLMRSAIKKEQQVSQALQRQPEALSR